MNILQFIETGGPGGAEQVVAKLSTQLVSLGDKVTVGTLREGWLTQEIDKLNIPRNKFNSTGTFDVALIWQIISFCRKNKIEVIHSHLLDSNFYCSIAAKLIGIHCICTEHGDIHHSQKKRFLKLKTKITSIFATKITAVSEYTKNALVLAGANPKKIVVLRNPIENIKAESPELITTRTHLSNNLNEQDWVWVHVGNLRPVKDQKTLISGFAEATKLSPYPQKLIIVGDGGLKQELQDLAQKLKIENLVIFLGFRKDVSKILALCNGFILSSLSEAMPMSILEAMRANLLVISSNVGGIPEIIQDSKTGFLFTSGNAIELGNKMANILNNKEQVNFICKNAEEIILKDCEISRVTERFKMIY